MLWVRRGAKGTSEKPQVGGIRLQRPMQEVCLTSRAGQVLRDTGRRAAYDGMRSDGGSFDTERWGQPGRASEDDFDAWVAEWFRKQGCVRPQHAPSCSISATPDRTCAAAMCGQVWPSRGGGVP